MTTDDEVATRCPLLWYEGPRATERALWWQRAGSSQGRSQPGVASESQTSSLRRTVLHQAWQVRYVNALLSQAVSDRACN